MYCYKTFHYKPYTKFKYILFTTSLPYRITLRHVITLTVKCPNIENGTFCKFRSNIKDICILNTMRNVSRQENFLVEQYLLKSKS